MDYDPTNPEGTAQPEGAAQNQNPEGSQDPKAQQHEGFQKRINELTAAKREADERYLKLLESQSELTSQLAQRQVAPMQVQREPSIEELLGEDVDPGVRKAVGAFTQVLERKFEQRFGQLQASMAVSGIERVARTMGVQDPEVVRLAEAVAKQYGMAPENAVTYAAGQVALKAPSNPRDLRGRFSQPNPTINTPPPPQPNPAAAPQNVREPAGFENWDPAKQFEWYDKNVPDKPM